MSAQGRLVHKEAHRSCVPIVWRYDGGGGVRQVVRGLECPTKPSGPSLVCLGAIEGLRAGEWPTQSPHLEMESQSVPAARRASELSGQEQ